MKTVICYCRYCNKDTYQTQEKGFSPYHTDTFTKAFFTVGTLGFGALAMSTYLTCTRCNTIREV